MQENLLGKLIYSDRVQIHVFFFTPLLGPYPV